MLPLRYPRLWLALGYLFVALALLVCLAPPTAPGLPSLFSLNDKVEHAAGYAILAVYFAGIYPRSRYFWIAISLFAMGVLVEFLQGWMALGRSRDPLDVIANTAGIVIGVSLARTLVGDWAQRTERLFARREQ
jgi:VanZ family protein